MSNKTEFIELGRFEREWGLHGALRGLFYNPLSPLIPGLDHVYINREGDRKVRCVLAAHPRPYRQGYLFQIKGVHSPETAKAWRNTPFFYPVALLPPLGDGEWYWYELMDAEVWDENGDYWGKVLRLEGGDVNSYLIIKSPADQEWLYPAHPSKLKSFDRKQKRLLVEAVPGLRDGQD